MNDTVELVLSEGDPDHSRARRFRDADVAADFAPLRAALPPSDCRIRTDASRKGIGPGAARDEPPGNATLLD